MLGRIEVLNMPCMWYAPTTLTVSKARVINDAVGRCDFWQ